MSGALPRKAFVDDAFMRITPTLVRALGGNTAAACVLVTIEYRARMFGFEHDGFRWWTANRQEISHDTGLSVPQVDRQLTKLVEGEYVLREKFSAQRSDHTYSYRIVYDDGGSMPSMYQARQQPPAALVEAREAAGTVGNTDVTDSGHEASPHVTDSGVHDVTDSRLRDVTDSRLLPSTKKEKKVKNTPTPNGSAVGDAGDVDALLDLPKQTVTMKVAPVDVDALFDEWWSHYPRKVGKPAARKNFAKALKVATFDQLLKGVQQYAIEVQGRPASKIKYPQGWLTDGRWEDEPESATQTRVGAVRDPRRDTSRGFFTGGIEQDSVSWDTPRREPMHDKDDPWADYGTPGAGSADSPKASPADSDGRNETEVPW